jgi:hypothetical protein
LTVSLLNYAAKRGKYRKSSANVRSSSEVVRDGSHSLQTRHALSFTAAPTLAIPAASRPNPSPLKQPNDRPYSIKLTVPPLAAAYFKST